MAYNEKLAQRVRERLSNIPKLPIVEEKPMMGGLTFMVGGKMCVGIIKDEIMCRIDPALHDESVEKPGVRTMVFTKRPMSGFIQVHESALSTQKYLNYWLDLAVAYNEKAKSSKKKTTTGKKKRGK